MTVVVVLVIVLSVLVVAWAVSRSGDSDPAGEQRRRRAKGIEFLLDEMSRSEKWAGLPEDEKAQLRELYKSELAALQEQPTAPPIRMSSRMPEPPVFVGPTQVPTPPKPMDWSWLAEQQANVFLFAGAFLVVVAALIYVGYSGDSLSGTLKVSLLGAYTLAFLAAGVVCLRIPTVNTAGQLFLGVSAVLVPLNFVLAGSIISDKDVSREVMWLAGSLTTAAFYTAIATLGLGRQYAISSGIALISAVTAFIAVTGLEPEWWPLPYLALSIGAVTGWQFFSTNFRARVGTTWVWLAHAGVLIVGLAALISALEVDTNDVSTRWFLAPAAGMALIFYNIEASRRKRGAVLGAALALVGLCATVVYGANVGEQYYSLILVAGGAIIIAAVRWAFPKIPHRILNEVAGADCVVFSHVAIASGLGFAILTAIFGQLDAARYAPESSWFLVAAFAAASAAYGMHVRLPGADWPLENRAGALGVLVSLAAIAPAAVYGANWSPEFYGLALVAVGVALGFGGRAWRPAWLDEDVRDFVAVVAVTLAWLPFEPVYEDHVRAGAGAHLAAALFYAAAAISVPRDASIGSVFVGSRDVPLRVSAGWLYAAGLTVAIGYVDVLRALPGGGTETDVSQLAYPLMALALAFLAIQVVVRRLRPDLSDHVYVMSLLAAIGSAVVARDSGVLSAVLTVFICAYAVAGVSENRPLMAAPSVVFGLAAVVAWRDYLDRSLYVIPISYSTIAIVAYAGGYAIKSRFAQWSAALRVTGVACAVVSPVVGFGLLAADADTARAKGELFETSALYEWSTLATGAVALLALVESSIARRGWLLVGASAVMLVAVLLQIGRFHPDNMQTYTAVIGTYLILLTLVGISRCGLIPGLESSVAYVEALGALTIMLPSFLQSLDGGWRYELALVVEAAGFLTSGVAMRRRGLLGASVFALVLVAGRVLFDAINAVPNWIVALIIGTGLLVIGLAITVSRDRWARWQDGVVSWWGEAKKVSNPSRRVGP
jgi:hypothetical protein